MIAEQGKAKTIFLQAAEIDSGEQRQAFIASACGSDEALRHEVEELLSHQQELGSFLESPAAELRALTQPGSPGLGGEGKGERGVATIDEPQVTERPGTVIGPYKLLEQIGEGGFGLVFVADQQQPIRRKVALKVIKPGMDSRAVIARFEAERQALALMDHPNIAKVLDAGTTASGRPFFVMELVRGVPITDYCDQNQFTPRQRLELFLSVCQAVQHAHQKGIIHRDLKPSNVMVMSHDGQPVVRVIDFGVAKAIGQQLTDKTIYTQFTQLIGTPLYMSPEQAGQSSLDVDTRSDIYSLGVLLYELLTGTTPFDKARLQQAGYDEIRRIIREEEPPRPSTRLSTTEQLPSIAASRGLEPRRLSGLVRGELDWIVMKALEKDRNRRYETANGLAQDIERYLHDEPVQACPPSAAYRLRKFLRRHKGPMLAAASLIVALLACVVGTTIGLARALTAERLAGQRLQRAEQAEVEATTERNAARAAEAKAAREAAIARAVTSFLQTDLLEMADPQVQLKSDMPVDPDVKLRTLVDRAERRVGARFRDQPEVEAAIRETLASAFVGVGEPARAAEQYDKVRAYQEATLGADHPDTLMTRLSFTATLGNSGRRAEAVPLAEEVFRRLKSKLGEDDQRTLSAMTNLAVAYLNVGRSVEALTLFREAYGRMRSKLGEEDLRTLNCLGNIASLSVNVEGASLTLLEEVVRLKQAKLGPKNRDTLGSMYWLANAYLIRGRVAEGVSLSEQTLKLDKEVCGADHPATACSMRLLGNALVAAGRVPEALPLLEEALRLHRANPGPKHFMARDSLRALADAYLAAKQSEKAVPLLEECLAISEQVQPDSWTTFAAKSRLGAVLRDQKKYAEAEPLLLQGYEGMRQLDLKTPPNVKVRLLTQVQEQLIQLYDAWGKQAEAEKWRKKLEAERAKQNK